MTKKKSEQKIIELGGNKYNGDWLRSVTEEVAVKILRSKREKSQIINAHKQANGLSIRNEDKAVAKK